MYSYLKDKTGVYIIKNTINNKVYVGSAKCLNKRIKDHIKRLKYKKHENSYLQNHYNKYLNSIYFEVLCFCDLDILIQKEQFYIDLYKSYIRKNGFNINHIANSRIGSKHSMETKNNFSINRKGKKKSDDTKNNMSEVKKGSNNPKSKLTETDVLNIRNNNTFKKDYSLNMSIKYNVSWHTINYILKRRTWKHI